MDPTVVNITVAKGSEEKTFAVHEDLRCYHSEYFCKAFNGQWLECEEKAIHLTGVSEDVSVSI